MSTTTWSRPLPGSYDRIVSMMSVAPVPASWLTALRPGGRLVTVLAGTGLLVTADKTPDGGAAGRTEWDRAGFMAARSGTDYPPSLLDQAPGARDADGEHVSAGRYPVVSIGNAWELQSIGQESVKHGLNRDLRHRFALPW